MAGAIHAEGLVKTFGEVRALDGVDIEVPEGTVLGLLGPNGAGKTTAVRVLTTLLRPDSGTASVAGIDVLARPHEVRRAIGLSGQFAAVDEYLTGRENLQMVGQLYQMSRRDAKARARELLERFGLADAADRIAKTYSGGMRRRLDLAAALVVSPPVMFMDEPTTGLDPRNRQALWEVIEDLVAGGTTLLLTTQYLEEADRLAHEICVVDHGRVIARGTADDLKRRIGGERVEVVVRAPGDIASTRQVLASHGAGETTVEPHTRRITVPVSGGARLLAEVIRDLDARGVEIDDIGLRRPTLDDVFISLTGHSADMIGNGARSGANTPDGGDGGAPTGEGGPQAHPRADDSPGTEDADCGPTADGGVPPAAGSGRDGRDRGGQERGGQDRSGRQGGRPSAGGVRPAVPEGERDGREAGR